MITAKNDRHEITRNCSSFKHAGSNSEVGLDTFDLFPEAPPGGDMPETQHDTNVNADLSDTHDINAEVRRNPARNTRRPEHLKL